MTFNRDSKYADLYRYLLTLQYPEGLDVEQRTLFIHNAGPYQIQQGMLFKLLPDERLYQCLETSEVGRVVAAMHMEDAGGHMPPEIQ